mgnify:CR=1 FL=1
MLVTVNEVISSMGLSLSLAADLKPTVTSTILKAQHRLGTELGTSLPIHDCTDYFYLNTDLFSGVVPDGMIRMKLDNMFVHRQTVVVRVGANMSSMAQVVQALAIDAEQGIVFISEEYAGMYAMVEYRSGIEDGEAPEDIKQAILLFASMVFGASLAASNGSGDSTGGGKTSEKAGQRAGDLAQGVLGRYKKSAFFAFRSLVHEQVAVE